MQGPLYQFFAHDHERLDALLRQSAMGSGEVNDTAYHEFRKGILKHISMEEKILLPAIQQLQGGKPFSGSTRIKLDHGAITALLVPVPSKSILHAIGVILRSHNPLEEGSGGLYEVCERLVTEGNQLEAVLTKVQSAPAIPVVPNNDKPELLNVTRRAVERAGYRWDDVFRDS
jgi:hypothetical protein